MKISHQLKDGQIFFTGDQHWFHDNIIKYTQRPFQDVEEMHEELILRHNAVVGKNDVVIHLGDFSFAPPEKTRSIFKRLNGQHHLVLGNHDHPGNGDFFRSRNDYLELVVHDVGEKQLIICCHYAFQVWNKSHHGSWHVHGHSHGKLPAQGKRQDVGVDTHDYYPYSFRQLKEIMDLLAISEFEYSE